MFAGLADFGHAWLELHEPDLDRATAWAARCSASSIGILPGLSATLVIALLTTLTIKLPAERRDPGADLLVRRRALRRLAHRDPAQHPRHRRQRRVVRRRLRAGAARRGRPRDRHRHLGRVRRHAVRRALPGGVHAARSPRSRSSFGAFEFFWLALFGVAMSGSIVGDDPLKGWLMGAARPVRRADRPGGPLRLRPLHLRLGRARRRHRADPGAGRRLRPGRGADDARRSGRDEDRRDARTRCCRAFARCSQYWRTVLRSGVIGVLTGLLPGVGEDVGRLDVVRRGEGGEQGEGAVRQGLDRRPDGGRDRRHGVDPRPHHPVPGARHPGLGAVGGADGGDDHPRHPARADDDDRSTRTSSTTWWR